MATRKNPAAVSLGRKGGLAHRACCGIEHDPANGKLHGCCVVCGVPWPCAYAGSPVKEFDEERSRLRDLLRDEFNRGHRLDSPWDCVEPDCPGFRKPCRKSCGCYQDATKAHISKVLKEINQS